MTQREIDRTASIIRPDAREVPRAPEPEPCNFWRVEAVCIAAVLMIWASTFFAIGRL